MISERDAAHKASVEAEMVFYFISRRFVLKISFTLYSPVIFLDFSLVLMFKLHFYF